MRFRSFRRLLAAAGFAAVASASAEAMTLVVQKGEVLVNRGDGFQPVTGSVEIEPGATVVVQEGAAAEFVCSEASRLAMVPGYHPVPADCGSAPQGQAFELDTAGYLLIGAGVLGGAIAIIEGTSNDDDKSVSAQ
jgi:hypothetical protein